MEVAVKMDTKISDNYIEILKEELVPALGCTEPIAIAYIAAKAKEILGRFPEKVLLKCSGNILKNVKSVTVPNTDGLTGIRASMLAGLVGGKVNKKMEVLSQLTKEDLVVVKKLLDRNFGDLELLETEINLHLIMIVKAGQDSVIVEIKHDHTNVCKIEKNGEIVYQNDDDSSKYLGSFTDRSVLTVKGIYEFANTVPLNALGELITKQIDYNIKIAKEGLVGDYGVNIGQTLLDIGGNDEPLRVKMKAYTAAASEARMSGCALPVITNSGSGNQGIATSIPVIVYARGHKLSEEKLYRGLVFSNLLTIHQKTLIGRLSAFCGAVSASCSSGAAITYLAGGSLEEINLTISNTLANVSGIICDGAKPSCAAKIASSLDAAYMSHVLAVKGKYYQSGNGILKNDIEETITAIGRIACNGMRTTDSEIIKIMLED
ncbi:MAG: serine dehydratase alpha chain [Firmicutes bacterium]|nr:serine dehydratase alpha chain [Bacillota bacterium]